jgi:hypothetical protein
MCKREYNNFITSSELKSLKQYHNQSTIEITWTISHRKMTRVLLDSILINIIVKSLPHHLMIINLARGELTYDGAQQMRKIMQG